MNDACQRFAEDPEGNAAHLRECAKCAAIYRGVQTHPVNVDALPLAPWEGAAYRAWPLVIGGALAVLAIALALCAAAGLSPIAALVAGMRSDGARAAIDMIDQKLRPLGPFVFAALFIAVNSLLVLLLRRAPRGIDA
jgi:hypothetical protein